MDAETLKPCPFCGEHAAAAETHAAGHTFYGIDCQGCGAQVHESDPQRAAMLWNARSAAVRVREAQNTDDLLTMVKLRIERAQQEPGDATHLAIALELLVAATRPAPPSDVVGVEAKERWEQVIRSEAQRRADADNEASSHCGAYGTSTADEYLEYVRADYEAFGQIYAALSAKQDERS